MGVPNVSPHDITQAVSPEAHYTPTLQLEHCFTSLLQILKFLPGRRQFKRPITQSYQQPGVQPGCL